MANENCKRPETALPLSFSSKRKTVVSTMATGMDLADKVELDTFITFPNTQSTWQIKDRLSSYPVSTAENCMPRSDSFVRSYCFRVELVGCGRRDVAVPKYAVLKMKSRYSLHSAERPSDTIDPGLLNEARALKQLNMNENPHSPILWDAKVEQHLTSCRTIQPRDDIGEDRKHFVTYLLMSLVPGISLKNDTFWTLNQEERRAIRRAFQTALGNLHKTWVILSDPNPEHLIWNPQRGILQIINYEHALTFNNFGYYRIQEEPHVSRTLPTRYQRWKNQWFADWRLSKDTIGAFSTGTDGSVFPDVAWLEVYKSEVLKEPRMPVKDIKRSIIGTAGSKIELNSEKKEYFEHISKMHNSASGCLIM